MAALRTGGATGACPGRVGVAGLRGCAFGSCAISFFSRASSATVFFSSRPSAPRRAFAVAIARVERGDHAAALALLLGQALALAALARLRGEQFLLALLDLRGHRRQLLEFGADLADALAARALEVAVVGEHPRQVAHALLLEQHLQFLLPAQRVGRAHQRGEFGALRRQRLFQFRAPRLQREQRQLLRGDRGLRVVQVALRARHHLIDAAQLAGGRVAIAFQALLLGRQRLDLRARAGQFLLRGRLVLRGLRARGLGRLRRRVSGSASSAMPPATRPARGRCCTQRGSSSECPVISGGTGSCSRSSTVGAMSRSARRAQRGLARAEIHQRHRSHVCAVCAWPVAGVAHHLEVAVVGGDDHLAADSSAPRAARPAQCRPPRRRRSPRAASRCGRPCRDWRCCR
jgi:hypothetical protein